MAQSQGLPNDGYIPGYGDLVSTNPIQVICYGPDGRCLEWSRGLVTGGTNQEARAYDKAGKVLSSFSYAEGTSEKSVIKGVNVTSVKFTGTKIIP